MPVYLDCNATAPLEPAVRETMLTYFDVEYGNAGSRTHEFGLRAKRAVQEAREAVAVVVRAQPEEIYFTSGATESNNLAILGLAPHGEATKRKHIISTALEHKAVLEPLEHLEKHGFEITLIAPNSDGVVRPELIEAALRPETLLVSIMHANNETGTIQPLDQVSEILREHSAYFHVDAAQGFGKELSLLRSDRIDLISISGHKIYGPKGIGALVARRRGIERIPLKSIMFGGGQERGLRPGTLPVPLIVGLGKAAEAALKDNAKRTSRNMQIRTAALDALGSLNIEINGDQTRSLVSTLNFSVPGVDAEAAMVALKNIAAISNGSACTSSSYEPSHVLTAMVLPEWRVQGAIRLSWCHMTDDVNWSAIVSALRRLQ
ncbi:cysteine desulfurase DndA [Bradyrhizobium sp. AUGA SZCCT0177]|uniref:cysteine desulfurase DndA n=1 Tax=Bradyrhizobium sp. AUGA SZCCT0177 TaxID=2807665 RepID=UPI001BA5A734|nr:cysteine desulfurase DndA [Bradyrhizobium sp. AUGA SZCCT0177]MBR1285373.1 cysteine desulfurase DndA [Bradyrhizobium sp. AUGA SZCCT0177]